MLLLVARARRPFVALDPRSRLALMFASSFIMFGSLSWQLKLGTPLFIGLFFLNERRYGAALKIAVVAVAATLIEQVLVPLLPALPTSILTLIAECTLLFMPLFLSCNLLIQNTTISQFIAALRKMHLPNKLIIPLSVMFRFIPTIKEELQSIRAAMSFKGIEVSAVRVLRSHLKTLEYALVPLLMSTATIANELAAASLSRGLDSETERTSLLEVRLGAADYLVIALCAAFVLWMVLKRSGL